MTMAYFIPSFVQKRVLRYALSHLELLETKDLDLDKLNIEWAKKSTVELRDLEIRKQKLSALLQLPPNLLIVKAKVPLLRITVPADLYKSGILIEANGLELALSAKENKGNKCEQEGVSRKDDGRTGPQKAPKSDRLRGNQHHVHDPGGFGQPSMREPNSMGARREDHLPTAIDLAESFLEAEPPQERDQLQSALVQPLYTDQSQDISESDGKISELGVGGGISLPGFVADFLKGVADRAQLSIQNTNVDLAVDLMLSSGKTASDNLPRTESVTLKLSIGEVVLEGITSTSPAATHHNRESESQHGQGQERSLPQGSLRRITLRRLKGSLVSESSLFTHLTRFTVPPSPNTTQPTSNRRTDIENLTSTSPLDPPFLSAAMGRGVSMTGDGNSPFHSPAGLRTSSHDTEHDNEYQDTQSVVVDAGVNSFNLGTSQHQQNDLDSSFFSDEDDPRYIHDMRSMINDIPGSFTMSHSLRGSHDLLKEPVLHNPRSVQSGASSRHTDSPIISSAQASESGQNSPQLLNLAQSKVFSHEEAESMYISAMTTPPPEGESALRIMPGNWEDSDSEDDQRTAAHEETKTDATDKPKSTEVLGGLLGFESLLPDTLELAVQEPATQESTMREPTQSLFAKQAENIDMATAPPVERTSSDTSQTDSPKPDSGLVVVKDVIQVDVLVIELPEAPIVNETDVVAANEGDQAASAQKESGLGSTSIRDGPRRSITIGTVTILGDLGLTKLAIITVQRLIELLKPASFERTAKAEPEQSSSRTMIRVKRLSYQFLDLVRGLGKSSPSTSSPDFQAAGESADADLLLKAVILDLKVTIDSDGLSSVSVLSIGKFSFGYATENIVSFDSGLKLRESTRDILGPTDQDLILKINDSPHHRYCELITLPLYIRLDLRRLDETFSWFGGFSSIIGLGSSMMSTITVVDSSQSPNRPTRAARGVHFEHESLQSQSPEPLNNSKQKVTIRLGGIVLDLEGAFCSFRLESTAVKIVSREEGIGLAVDRFNVTGPDYGSDGATSSITAKLVALRIEYLTTPKDVDLARLLALLSPSKNGYKEEDDDILLGTLFRQRRQGGVVRVTAEKYECRVLNVRDLQCLPALGEEMKKLSTVAKYLPADDRPGIMTILLVREVDVQVQFVENIGVLQFTAQNGEIAHISIPNLVALSIGKLNVIRNLSEELLGEAVSPFSGKPSPPAIMARYIGNELEPTVKIRLYSLRAEYYVSTITAILGLHDEVSQEKLANLASSIATVTDQQRVERSPELFTRVSSRSDTSSMSAKILKVDCALRDVVLGLNPRNSPARGLLVLTDAQLVGTLPRDDILSARFDINKASLLAVDDAKTVSVAHAASKRASYNQKSQTELLLERGYVSLSYISAARATLESVKSASDGSKTIEVELRDNLLVIESCADSTQTLQNILNGLQPPPSPNKELRYRTEVVPVEDMLASFSGKAFETLDQEDSQDVNLSLGLDDGDVVEDEVSENLEFVSSFYNPDPSLSDEGIADSIAQGDPEALLRPTATRKIRNKPLLESFQDQCEVSLNESKLHFREDHFGDISSVGGTAHRWDAKKNTYELSNEPQIRASPLIVRVRDVHVIWNLFDGYDWQKTRDVISQAVAAVEEKATEQKSKRHQRQSLDVEEEEESVIGDFLFNSIYIGIPTSRDPKELSRQVNRNIDDLVSETESYATSSASASPSRQSRETRSKGRRLRLRRSKYHKMTFELKGVSADMVVFPPSYGETQSSLDIRINDFEIFDHVPTSTWKKFATYMHDAGERESGTSMVHIEILNVKPVPTLAASEMILKVYIL